MPMTSEPGRKSVSARRRLLRRICSRTRGRPRRCRRTPGTWRPPRRCGQSGRRSPRGSCSPADLEVVGGGDGDVVGDAEALGLGGHVLLPAVRRHVQAVLDGGAAEVEQVVAERIAGGALRLGDGEGDEVPGAVPASPGRVLGVGQPGALQRGAERPHALQAVRPEDGLAPVAVADRTAPRPPAGAGRPHLVAGQPAASATGYSSSATIVPSWWAMPSTRTRVGISTSVVGPRVGRFRHDRHC